MKILITGAAGFLGLHLVKCLKNAAVLETNPSGIGAVKKNGKASWVNKLYLLDIAPFNKSEYPKDCIFIQGDVRDVQLINRLVKNVEYVIHAAAALPLWKPKEIFDINVSGTKNLLEASIKFKIKRFVFISSTAVYGVPKIKPPSLDKLDNDKTLEVKYGISENDPLVGVGSYGESKIQAEKICNQHRKTGLVVTIIRPKTFVGTHRLGVFEILFDWIKDGKRIPVIGSGNNRYQLLDVDDLVEVIYLCLTLPDSQKVNNTFNIGAEKFGTVRQDLEKLFEYAYKYKSPRLDTTNNDRISEVNKINKQKKSTILPTPAFLVKPALRIFEKLKLSPLYQWIYDTADHDSYVSINRLIDTLSWHPKYSNSEALIKAYQWYLDNYKEIKSKTPGLTHTVGWNQGILGWFKRFL